MNKDTVSGVPTTTWFKVDGNTHGFEGAIVLAKDNPLDFKLSHSNWVSRDDCTTPRGKSLAYENTLSYGYNYWTPLTSPN